MPNKKFQVPINLVNLDSDPVTGSEGDMYYNTTSDVVKVYANGSWIQVGTSLSQEEVQDYVAPLFLHNNHTNASVTYEDALNELHIDVTNAPSAGYTAVVKHSVRLNGAIAKGQAVYVSSSNGTNMVVSKASNVSEATSSKTMGLLEASGGNNAEVNVITEGLISGLNTNSANAGDPVWLGVDGELIYGLTNKPYAPAHLVFIGIVTRKNANNGEIFVKVQNGFELNELHSVGIGYNTTVTDNEVLAYDSATSLWKNQTASQAGLAALSGATFTGDIGVNGGDITTTATTASLFNANATTINIGSEAHTVSIGDILHTGTTTVQNNLYVAGNITFGGTSTTLSATNLDITDSLIYLSVDNTADIIDIGWVGAYVSSSTHLHTGFVRDASDGKWKLFSGISAEPTTVVDFNGATYDILKIGALEVTDASTTRTNLGLGTMATETASNYAPVSNPLFLTAISFEGTTSDANETHLTVVDPTGDRTITLPDDTGTVALTKDTAKLASANAFTVGGHEIKNNSDVVALTIKPNSTTQTANLVELKTNNNASTLALFDQYGSAAIGGNNTLGSSLGVQTAGSTTQKGITVRGTTSQTAFLQEWQSWNGTTATTVAAIASDGGFRGSTFSNTTGTIAFRIAANRNFQHGVTESYGGGLGVVGINNAATVPSTNPSGGGILYAEGGALKWRGSGGLITTISGATATSESTYASLASANAFTVGGHTITTTSSVVPLTITGAAGQTVDLFTVNDSVPSAVFNINSSGQSRFTKRVQISTTGNTSFPGVFSVYDISGGATPLIISTGGLTQLSDQLQLRNNSGTAIAGFGAAGELYSGSTSTLTMTFPTPIAIASTSQVSSTTVTYNTTYNHGLVVGQYVNITGVTSTPTANVHNISGTVATVTSSTQFTMIAAASGSNTSSATGTINSTRVQAFIQGTSTYGGALKIKAPTNKVVTVTAATGAAGTVTYTAAQSGYNTLVVGDAVTITGLGIASGSSLNLASQIVVTSSATQFTISNATVGVSSGTGTATVFAYAAPIILENSAGTTVFRVDQDGSFRATSLANINAFANANLTPGTTGWTLGTSSNTTNIPLKIQNTNAGTVTGDLTQWLNNVGTVLVSIPSLASGSGSIFLRSFGTGGVFLTAPDAAGGSPTVTLPAGGTLLTNAFGNIASNSLIYNAIYSGSGSTTLDIGGGAATAATISHNHSNISLGGSQTLNLAIGNGLFTGTSNSKNINIGSNDNTATSTTTNINIGTGNISGSAGGNINVNIATGTNSSTGGFNNVNIATGSQTGSGQTTTIGSSSKSKTVLNNNIINASQTALTTSATITGANILTKNIYLNTATTAVAFALDTGTNIETALSLPTAPVVGSTIEWVIINDGTSAATITISAGTAHTFSGTNTVAINTAAKFITRKVATNSYATYRLT